MCAAIQMHEETHRKAQGGGEEEEKKEKKRNTERIKRRGVCVAASGCDR